MSQTLSTFYLESIRYENTSVQTSEALCYGPHVFKSFESFRTELLTEWKEVHQYTMHEWSMVTRLSIHTPCARVAWNYGSLTTSI